MYFAYFLAFAILGAATSSFASPVSDKDGLLTTIIHYYYLLIEFTPR